MYKIYATLLDSYQRYLDSDTDDAMLELIDKINRKPFFSKAAEEGTAFNELIDAAIKDQKQLANAVNTNQEFLVFIHNGNQYEFRTSVVLEFTNKFREAIPQVYTEAILHTRKGDVLLYGKVDEILGRIAYDIKCTGQFEFPKFTNNWQHLVYPYCLRANGIMIESFEYAVTDYSRTWNEEYVCNPDRDISRLMDICERFIGFLEAKRDQITDKKIFGEEVIKA